MAKHHHLCVTNHVDRRVEPHVCRCGAIYTMDGWRLDNLSRMITVVGDGAEKHVDCDLRTDDHGITWRISVDNFNTVQLTSAQVSELFEFFIRNTDL